MYDSKSPHEHSSCKDFAFYEATYIRMHVLNPTQCTASWRAGVPFGPNHNDCSFSFSDLAPDRDEDAEVCDCGF